MQSKGVVEKLREQHGDSSKFLIKFNPSIQFKASTNIERAYLGTAPTLNAVQSAYSQDIALTWIMAQVEAVNDFVNVKEKIDFDEAKPNNQMLELARVILSEYSFLKISELALFFHRFKSGHYLELYGSVDPLKITRSLRIFCNDRRTEITKYENIRKQNELEKNRSEWSKTCVTREQYEQMKSKEI